MARPKSIAHPTISIKIKKSDHAYLNDLKDQLKESRGKCFSKMDIITSMLKHARENINNIKV